LAPSGERRYIAAAASGIMIILMMIYKPSKIDQTDLIFGL